MYTTTHTGTSLHQRMTENMRMRVLEDRTRQAYIGAARRLTVYLAAPRGRTTDTTQSRPIQRPAHALKPDIGQTSVALSSAGRDRPRTVRALQAAAPPTVAQYGGRFLARGGQIENLEGDWSPRRVVIIEFPSLERARAWSDSPEYASAKLLRQKASTSRLIVVEGVAPT